MNRPRGGLKGGLVIGLLFLTVVVWGQARRRPRSHWQLGANITLALYQYDASGSDKMKAPAYLPQTFDSASAEARYLQDTYGLKQLTLRHVRSVGLLPGERFHDGAYVGDRPMLITIRVKNVAAKTAQLSLTITADERTLLDRPHLQLHNFETVALKGNPIDHAKTTVEATGPKAASARRGLLATVTVEIVPVHELRDRPRDLSHPTDQYGRPLTLRLDDVFVPPIIVRRVTPRVPGRRATALVVDLEGLITPDGQVTNIRVLHTVDPDFNEMAMDAFRAYRILPARLNGKPVYAILHERVVFEPVP